MAMTRIDLDQLKESPNNYDLYQIACRASGHKSGIHEIDIESLRIFPATRSRLTQFSLTAPPAPQEKPVFTLSPAVMQVLKTWKPPIGVVNSEYNGSLLADTIAKNFGNVYSHQNLEAAVVKLGDQLVYERGYSPQEVTQVWSEWWANYAPKDLVRNASNQAAIKASLDKFFHGLVSIPNLNAASANLLPTLDLIPQPKQPTAAESSSKAEARMRKDFSDSMSSNTVQGVQQRNQQNADADKKKANDKEFSQINSLIEFEISNYTVGHSSGVTDYSRTESGRDSLRKVRDSHNRDSVASAKACLSAVRLAKAKM
jgi:hypothetical protein